MRVYRLLVCLLALSLLAACSSPLRKAAVPEALTTQAQEAGLEGVRYRVGIDTDALRNAERAVSSMIHSQAIGDLYRIYLET